MNRVFKNTSALFIAHLIARIFSLGLTLLLAEYFSTGEELKLLGKYLVIMSLTNMIASIAELGMHAPLIREMTLYPQHVRHFVGNALIIRLFLAIVAFVVMIESGRLLNYSPKALQMIILLGSAEVINSIAQLFRCVFRAFEEMKYEAFTVVVERSIVVFIGGMLIVFVGVGLVDFCVMVLIASVLNLALSVGIVLKQFTSLRFDFDLGIWRNLMSQALPFAFGNIFYLIYFRIDIILISKLSPHGDDAIVWYGLAYTIVNAFTILPGAFMGAMFPAMSRALEDKEIDFSPIFTDALRWMFLLGMPFAVGLATLAPKISAILFPSYGPETIAPALSLLSWSGGLIFLTTVVITVLRAADKRYPFTLLMATTALLNIALNFQLIPRFSHVGAAITMIISEAYLFIASLIYIFCRISKLTEFGFAIKAPVVSAVMGVGLLLLRERFSIWLLIPAAMVFYFGVMAIFKEIRGIRSERWGEM